MRGAVGMGGRRGRRLRWRRTGALLLPLIVASNVALVEGAFAQSGPSEGPLGRDTSPLRKIAPSRRWPASGIER